MTDTLTLQIAQVVPCTEAEGPGRRFAVWFQGCPLRCPGCCNAEFLPFKGGETRTVREIADWMSGTLAADRIEGITLLGGEPTAHAPGAVALSKAARELGLSVMVFTGYTVEELREKAEPAVLELLSLTDILVDGRYDRDQPDTERRWIGSKNQRIHFLTGRYSFDEAWRRRNTLEIRVDRGGVSVNGFPAAGAVGLWKGWTRKKPVTPNPTDRPPR